MTNTMQQKISPDSRRNGTARSQQELQADPHNHLLQRLTTGILGGTKDDTSGSTGHKQA
jgi:hypothetical protein